MSRANFDFGSIIRLPDLVDIMLSKNSIEHDILYYVVHSEEELNDWYVESFWPDLKHYSEENEIGFFSLEDAARFQRIYSDFKFYFERYTCLQKHLCKIEKITGYDYLGYEYTENKYLTKVYKAAATKQHMREVYSKSTSSCPMSKEELGYCVMNDIFDKYFCLKEFNQRFAYNYRG